MYTFDNSWNQNSNACMETDVFYLNEEKVKNMNIFKNCMKKLTKVQKEIESLKREYLKRR